MVHARYLTFLLCLSPFRKFRRCNLYGMALLIRHCKTSHVTWSLSALKNVDYRNMCCYVCVYKLPLLDFHPSCFIQILCLPFKRQSDSSTKSCGGRPLLCYNIWCSASLLLVELQVYITDHEDVSIPVMCILHSCDRASWQISLQ
jgi:hypothetical protein